MSAQTLANLRSIITTIKPGDFMKLQEYRILSLRCLSQVELNFNFLDAAIKFWDPVDHVFRFNGYEICPLYEEFAAIMDTECSSRDGLVQIIPNMLFPQDLSALIRLPFETCRSLVTADSIPLMKLRPLILQKQRNSLEWKRLIAFYLYAQFLLVSPRVDGDVRIFSLMEQLEERRNPFPLILAETLCGLDNVKHGRTHRLGGSPLLLQV